MSKPIIVAICGPAASGKDTLAKELFTYMKMENIPAHLLISDTTRPMRSKEENGIDYFFRDEKEFIHKYYNGDYVEFTSYRNWFYGTDKSNISNSAINIGVFNLEGILALRIPRKYTIIPIYLDVPFWTRMKRYRDRAGKITFEQIRRAIADSVDFANIDLYLENLFRYRYLVLKGSNILENCQKITQHLVSIKDENY